MKRHYYSDLISSFCETAVDQILGELSRNNEFSLEKTQADAWIYQIKILQKVLHSFDGSVFFEYAIPRMGKRIDVVLLINNALFVIEFKVGEKVFLQSAVDQVWDYALDLKNFHETSHHLFIAPILIATDAKCESSSIVATVQQDKMLLPVKTNSELFAAVINAVLEFADGEYINADNWTKGRYAPTPTIIEAAMALYNGHSVSEITRSEAENLSVTTNTISNIIHYSKTNNKKAICFVTGVPGAGKTLVGLDISTKHFNKEENITSVFLSGNGPLVAILREALTRDKVRREKEKGKKVKKGEVMSEVKLFIQNVHHFRDECLIDLHSPPFDHVAIFDEAQRAWSHEQTANFMRRKKNVPNFSYSEPEFLISCLDRHKDWAVIVCLVGGGQEINTGEAGISEWVDSLNRSFPHWEVYVSNRLTDNEYAAGNALEILKEHKQVVWKSELHLSVSLRSFRAEHLSLLVKNILDINIEESKRLYQLICKKYPIVITRDLSKAKQWLKAKARGTERYGIVVSSKASRLKPDGIDVKSPMNPVNWFLEGKDDVRSSYYLEDVATEFHVQGLELDWSCVIWDADFRYTEKGWSYHELMLRSEKATKWNNIGKNYRKQYLKNAYRVLLTRARQGMIIVIPTGCFNDLTRQPNYYDSTYNYLREIGIESI